MSLSFRTRLIALIVASVAVSVSLVGWLVEANFHRSFDLAAQGRTDALVDQFNADFEQRGVDISRRVAAIADSEQVLRIALAAAQPTPDFAPFVNDAPSMAAVQQLNLLEILTHDGAIITSAQWPARFGYKETWVSEIEGGTPPASAFLKREQQPDGETLAIVAVKKIRVRDATIYIVGGQRLDAAYFQSLVPPFGLRPVLYRFTDFGFSASNFVEISPASANLIAKAKPGSELQSPAKIAPFIEEIRVAYLNHQTKISKTVDWTSDPEDAETIHSSALVGRNGELLGALLVATPVREQVRLARHVRNVALAVGAGGILFGVLLAAWLAGRVTRPVEQLAAAASHVAQGKWDTHVTTTSSDEIGQLAAAFNHMTHELITQREQLVQTERVAAWRELARRLAHELKNPLFPLQITVENLLRARETSPQQFDEVFREGTTTLLAELQNLKNIVGRFSDFSKMPTPQLQSVDVNHLLREAAQLFQAQFAREPVIKLELPLADQLPNIDADPILLRRAFENLILNALDAMPQGGTLRLQTAMNLNDHRAIIEVTDTGAGLTPEECERLFTPYYTTKQHGTGLGLAIVQSVVADHNGVIGVKSEKSMGTTFHIELPIREKGAV